MTENLAALLTAPYGNLHVEPAPYTAPGAGEIVIRNRAVAVNPLDSIKQSTGNLMYGWLPYPAVLGEDVAGEVVEVGLGVTRFVPGDRVVGYAVGMEKKRNHRAEGGFQLFSVVRSGLAAPLPDGMDVTEAVVLPLAISTAASALFQQDQLVLRHPGSAPSDDVVVVWGGSTSVGSNAIQLATAAGYRVITTASRHNHDRMRELGAVDVFDYRSDTVVADIASAVDGRTVAGILAVGTGSGAPCVAIARAVGSKRVSFASPSVSFEDLPRRPGISMAFVRTMAQLVSRTGAMMVTARVHGIRARFVWGSTLMDNEVGPMLWEEFLPSALANGRYIAAPTAQVVGTGLEHVQVALDELRAGVSARKLVVRL